MTDRMWDQYIRNSKGWRNDPIAQVHPRIYLGSRDQVEILTFNNNSITHAINCAEECWNSKWFLYGFPDRYECIGAADTLEFNITSVYPKFEEAMNRFLADPEARNIFVHCQCGINRSAFLLLIYLCRKFHYKIDDAVKCIAQQRPCCFRNTAFRQQVMDYIKKLD